MSMRQRTEMLSHTRGAMGQVHSSWLTKINLFKDLTLNEEFYVALTHTLQTQLFAPHETLIGV